MKLTKRFDCLAPRRIPEKDICVFTLSLSKITVLDEHMSSKRQLPERCISFTRWCYTESLRDFLLHLLETFSQSLCGCANHEGEQPFGSLVQRACRPTGAFLIVRACAGIDLNCIRRAWQFATALYASSKTAFPKSLRTPCSTRDSTDWAIWFITDSYMKVVSHPFVDENNRARKNI